MANLHFSVRISAPREKVWHTMLDDATYREWTAAFMPGSYYRGDWSEGSEMLFLGPGEPGEKEGGMAAIVKEKRTQEFISLEYRGEIKHGEEIPWGTNGFENYTFTDTNDGTEVVVDLLNLPDEYVDMVNGMWPKALEKLKEVAER